MEWMGQPASHGAPWRQGLLTRSCSFHGVRTEPDQALAPRTDVAAARHPSHRQPGRLPPCTGDARPVSSRAQPVLSRVLHRVHRCLWDPVHSKRTVIVTDLGSPA